MNVQLSRYKDSRSFLEEVGNGLYVQETVNNLILGVSEQLVADPKAYKDPFFASLTDVDGEMLLAAVMTPPHNMILAGGEKFNQALPTLIDHLQKNQIRIPGVIGPVQITEAFENHWRQCGKQTGQVKMRQRVYEVRMVRLPPLPEGHFKIALPKDVLLLARWHQAFSQEALREEASPDIERTQALITEGNFFVWEFNGDAVSMAMKTRPIAHSITVSGVYTPPEYRCQGYATALVARLSQHLLDSGYQFVNLFTDLENPTSNSIYRKIGYHPVCDFRMVTFPQDK